MRVYLVQRLLKATNSINPFSFGGGLMNGGLSDEAMKYLKSIFSFDYMGAAEFEWGAVPTAIRELFINSPEAFTIELAKPLYVICPPKIKVEVTEWLANASKGKHDHLKEYLGLEDAMTKGNSNYVGWLKIEDDKYCKEPFMFFIDKEVFENTCKLFNIEI